MTRRLRRALSDRPSRDGRTPELSVVVPVYDVEQYVAECLDSVLGQDVDGLEVVVVDDGARDRSVEVVQEYVRRDPRVRLVRQANQGLGAARNTGIREARGRYLAFLDSDDVLPPGAYPTMLGTIDRTGSDLVVGTLREDHGDRRTTGRLMAANHRHRRERATLDDQPLVLADVFAQNKVYRRAFWDRAGLAFPVGVRYEDQPTLTRAFLAADRFDVIPETVYLRRVRDDGSSITQTRHLLADLRDRVQTKRDATAVLTAARPDLAGLWFGTVLAVDMWEYFRAGATADEEYWTLLREAVAEFWNDATVPFEQTEVPVQQRLMGWLVGQDRRPDLLRLLEHLEQVRRDPAVEVRDDRVVCLLPGCDDPAYGAPAAAYTLRDSELVWQARVQSARWTGTRLEVRGFALVRNLPTGGRATALRAWLEGPDGVVVELAVTPRTEPLATRAVGRPNQDHDACGFALEVDAGRLAGDPSGSPVRWRLRLERTVAGIRRGGGPTGFRADAVDLGPHPLDGQGTARLVDDGGELVLEVDVPARPRVPATGGSQGA